MVIVNHRIDSFFYFLFSHKCGKLFLADQHLNCRYILEISINLRKYFINRKVCGSNSLKIYSLKTFRKDGDYEKNYKFHH